MTLFQFRHRRICARLDQIVSRGSYSIRSLRWNRINHYGCPLRCSSGFHTRPSRFQPYTSDIIQLIRGTGLNVHAYADDLQVYGHTTPSESSILQSRISDCIESIREWMRSNRLRLNPTKTEFIWVGSSNCLGKFESTDPMRVSGELGAPVMKVRDLGVIIDSEH